MSMMVGRRKYSVVKRKFNCNYCGHSKIIEVEKHDYLDRMCTECHRALRTPKNYLKNED